MKMFLRSIALCGAIALALGGCSSNPQLGKANVAVVISNLNSSWLATLGQTAKQHLDSLGYNATLFDAQNSLSTETELFDRIVSAGFRAILLNPTDAGGSVANVRAAKNAGIPVFCMDREISAPGLAATQILSDNHAGGAAIGQYMAGLLNGQGTYVELLGPAGENNARSRSQGFHSVADTYPGLKMLAQHNADFDRDKACKIMEGLLAQHGDIDAVVCGNDDMAMGAYQAVLAADKVGEVKIFGFDGTRDVLEAIRNGNIAATEMQFPKTIAVTAATYANRYLQGDRRLPQKLSVAVELVTASNVGRYEAQPASAGS